MKPGAKGNYRLFQECHPHSHEALALQRKTWNSSNKYTQSTLTQVYQIFSTVIIGLPPKKGFCTYVISFVYRITLNIYYRKKEIVHKL